MASLMEMVRAAEYKRQNSEAADPLYSGAKAISSGFSEGFDGRDQQLENALKIIALKEKVALSRARTKNYESLVENRGKEQDKVRTADKKVYDLVNDTAKRYSKAERDVSTEYKKRNLVPQGQETYRGDVNRRDELIKNQSLAKLGMLDPSFGGSSSSQMAGHKRSFKGGGFSDDQLEKIKNSGDPQKVVKKEGKVLIEKNGQQFRIDKSKLNEAIKRGATLVR